MFKKRGCLEQKHLLLFSYDNVDLKEFFFIFCFTFLRRFSYSTFFIYSSKEPSVIRPKPVSGWNFVSGNVWSLKSTSYVGSCYVYFRTPSFWAFLFIFYLLFISLSAYRLHLRHLRIAAFIIKILPHHVHRLSKFCKEQNELYSDKHLKQQRSLKLLTWPLACGFNIQANCTCFSFNFYFSIRSLLQWILGLYILFSSIDHVTMFQEKDD